MGWFSTSNAQSAIVSMLTPVVVWMAYESKRTWLVWITVAAAYLRCSTSEPDWPFAAMLATTVGLAFTFLVTGMGMETGGGAVCGVGYRCRVYEIRAPCTKNQNYYSDYTSTQQGYVAEEMMEKMPELKKESISRSCSKR